ncbi:MAG TPA: DUF1214 domain-containing protein [Vicinamibacterales bacterium]|nr:DUF1214 domain-containing protein [Vicinamibacterales bacterium]
MKAAVGAAHTFSAYSLAEHTRYRRAVEAAIWGMPIVSVDAMRQAFLRDAGARYNDIVYLSKQADWKFQLATPNASTRYVYVPINTKSGPVVLDIPPAVGAGLFGTLNDAWQTRAADIWSTGEDGDQGTKYVVLPPAYKGAVPAGFVSIQLRTYNSYSCLCAMPASPSPADVAKAIDLARSVRAYPLAEAVSPPPQRCIDMAGKLFDGIARFDDTFYDSLARIVDEEPVQERDSVAMAYLQSIGIQKDKPFKPDPALREMLKRAIVEAREGFIQSMIALPPFVPRAHWTVPGASVETETGHTFEKVGYLDLDARAQLFFFGCAPAQAPRAIMFVLAAMKDATGAPLHGETTYHLHVPPNVPSTHGWAVTVYDLETAAFIRGAARVEINSDHAPIRKNVDGSVDLFFAPAPPRGLDANWIGTRSGGRWIALFRFCGPQRAVLDRRWVLPDIEPLKRTPS